MKVDPPTKAAMLETLQHDSWRVFRIISEFIEGFETMTHLGPSVSMFGSARMGPDSPYYAMSKEVATKIAARGLAVITGGGPGLMDAANEGAQAGNGVSCGISIDLPFESGPNTHIDRRYRLHLRYFFVRKVLFVRYAQAFVVLPGGLGTLDELFEALTLIQTKKIQPFPIILMGKSYWQGIIDWLKETALAHKAISESDLSLFTMTDDPDEAVEIISRHYNKASRPIECDC